MNIGIKTLINIDLTTAIPSGWFDLNSKQKCSGHHRDSSTCNYLTGQCDGVCAARFRDSVCEKSDIYNINFGKCVSFDLCK